MKIVHAIDSLDPETGGPPKIAASLAAAQAARTQPVMMLHHDGEAAGPRIGQMLEHIPGARDVQRVNLPAYSVPRLLFGPTPREIAAALDGADVVHMHGIWLPLMVRVAREARRRSIPYTILMNGMLDPWSLAQRRLKKKLSLALFQRRMLNGAAFLHVGNAEERDLIEPLGLRTGCQIIPNGLFPEELEDPPAPGGFYEACPQLGGAPFALFMSRLHYKKGPEILIEAFARIAADHPGFHLVVAGPDGGARGDVQQRVQKHGLAERVHLVGPIYGESKRRALTDAAMFVLPSHQEGFSMAITEALGWGLPCVVTYGCHYGEVAEAGAGYVVATQAQPVAEAVAKLMADAELRRRMGEAGRQLVLDRFTWPRIAERTFEHYHQAGVAAAL